MNEAKDNMKIDESFFKKLSKPQLPPSSRPKVTLNDIEELLNRVYHYHHIISNRKTIKLNIK